jgi:quercetin dioxygenase-like cupin family protein
MLHITMKPGAVIPAHLHNGMAEALYVTEDDFTNEGKQYHAGTLGVRGQYVAVPSQS